MKLKMAVKGADKVVSQLNFKAQSVKNCSVIVGFTDKSALFVHENMEPKTLGKSVPRPSGLGVYWGPSNYGPKFLEGTAREFAGELVGIVSKAMKGGATLLQGILIAGLRLQRESQLRVPVEYGTLKNSAFTREET